MWRGSLAQAVAHTAEVEPRGEYVVVVDGAPEPAAATDDELLAEVQRLREAGMSTRDVASEVATRFDVSRRRVYALATSA